MKQQGPAFWFQWVLATGLAFGFSSLTTGGLIRIAVVTTTQVDPHDTFVSPLLWIAYIALALLLGIAILTFAQWLALRTFLRELASLRWLASSISGLAISLASILLVGVLLVICLLASVAVEGPRDYTPYAETMLLIFVATAYVILGWISLWVGIAYKQWFVLQRYISSGSQRWHSWAFATAAGGTVAGIVSFVLLASQTSRMYGTSGPLDTSNLGPGVLALTGVIAGVVHGAITGFALYRLLRADIIPTVEQNETT
ncbi:MAG: hypothetical protein ACJ78Q_03455 [Chloroflexia bacterium]